MTNQESLLTLKQRSLFLKKVYSFSTSHCDIDFADYKCIKTKHQNLDVITFGWASPHEDDPCDTDEVFSFKTLDIDQEENICFLQTLSSGEIVGHFLEINKIYSFLAVKTHALVPEHIAISILKSQRFDNPETLKWIESRKVEGYSETAKLAVCFLDTQKSNIVVYN